MLTTMAEFFNDSLNNQSDPRVNNLLLMKSPFGVFLICLIYILTVFIGPMIMKNRKPYEIQRTMTIYNAFQVYCNLYLFYECLQVGWPISKSLFQCNNVHFHENPEGLREMTIIHLYFLSKFTEFLDTMFFILRKKHSQVTFLHVYHHVSMPFYMWVATKFYPGGSLLVTPFLNCFIHVVMYSYYLLAGLGPHMQPYLWWKKYLTSLQLVQFVLGTMHFLVVFFSGSSCNISSRFIFGYVLVGSFFFVLFNNFYKKTYKKPTMNGTAVTSQ